MKLRYFASIVTMIIGCPGLFAGEVWRDKPAGQWTEDDARLVLNDSPWAKRVKVRYVESLGGRRSSGGGAGRIPSGSPIPGGNPMPGGGSPLPVPGGGGPGGVRTLSEIVVRWESASAIRAALSKLGAASGPTQPEDSYVIGALAVPEMGEDLGDLDDPSTLNRIRDGARLLVGNKRSVIPDRVQVSRRDQGLMVYFVFRKDEVGPLTDEKVKLLARIGPAQLSAEFKTKDMKLQGTPDL